MSELRARRAMRIAVLIAGLAACTCLAAAPRDVVRQCAETVSPALSGIKSLGAACPQLEQSLRSLGLDQTLYDGWRERLSRDALRELVNLEESYGGPKPGKSPQVSALPGIVQALVREHAPLATYSDAVRAWFKTWLARHPGMVTWLDRLLDRMGQSATLLNLISFTLVGLVLATALAVIVNELRANRANRHRRSRAAAVREPQSETISAESGGSERPALDGGVSELLQILVGRLMQTRRLATERSLTHRELVARSTFDSDSQRAVFAEVSTTAESLLYGPQFAAPEELNRVLREGRVLLAQLSNRSGAR